MIPKDSGTGLRPLGIPTVRDRAAQALMLLALEPEWEAKFDTNSFGFRPGYSAFDAKWLVTRQLQGLPKFFLDADIKGCFENINHEFLLKKLNTIRIFEHQIRA
jgi:RNA-directed DNA polymerase